MADELKIEDITPLENEQINLDDLVPAKVELHRHSGEDSPKINENDIENAIDKSTVVLLTTDQTINGVKTFGSIPVLPASDPTTDNQAVRKSYVDDTLGSTELVANDDLIDSADTERSSTSATYEKVKEITINEVGGEIRVKFDLKRLSGGSGTNEAGARIYVNGTGVGTEQVNNLTTYSTFSEDITVSSGDLVQLYVKEVDTTIDAANVRNFRLYYDKIFSITSGTVDIN